MRASSLRGSRYVTESIRRAATNASRSACEIPSRWGVILTNGIRRFVMSPRRVRREIRRRRAASAGVSNCVDAFETSETCEELGRTDLRLGTVGSSEVTRAVLRSGRDLEVEPAQRVIPAVV